MVKPASAHLFGRCVFEELGVQAAIRHEAKRELLHDRRTGGNAAVSNRETGTQAKRATRGLEMVVFCSCRKKQGKRVACRSRLYSGTR